MPTQVQFRRGTTAQNNNFIGASGELSVNTSNNSIRVHDGVTTGGTELATLGFAANATNIIAGTISASRLPPVVSFQDITATGNLTVSGTVTTINTEEINLADNQIVLNSNHSGAPVQDAGLIVNRGSSANVSIFWDETDDRWSVNTGSSTSIIHNTGRDVVLGTETSGAYVGNLVQGSGISLSGLGNEGATPTIALATSGVSASTYGGPAVQSVITVDTFGRITSASNVTSTVANTNITGNIIASQIEPTGVSASTYGGALAVPVIVVDQQGRITSASNATITAGVTTGNVLNRLLVQTGTSLTAVAGNTYAYSANVTITLPASPVAGHTVGIINLTTLTTAVINRNSSNIMGLAEDLIVDSANAAFELVYTDATYGWRLV